MGTHYISVWTAIYDFTPVRDDSDQLTVKKGQMLLLLDASNDDWWRFRIKTDRNNNTDSSGFVPRGYTQAAQFVSLAVACSDYVARADGDLTISEKEPLLVYAIEEDWVLVTSLKQRATGYVLRARIRIEEAKEAIALYDYSAANSDELSFRQGEILTIISNNGEGWWHCANENRQIGLVPRNYIKPQTGSEGTESGGTLLRGTHDAVNEIQRSIDLVNQNSPPEVIEVLATHGLKDLTFSIDLSTFPEFPDAYGDYNVYRGRLFDGTWVAVKVKVTSQQYFETSEGLTDVAREVYVWSKCSHINVLSLRGIALFRDRIAIISPWIEENNLLRYLERTPGVNRYKLCAEICKGLSYLHTVGIIHGGLRSSNIYVSSNGTPLIADLGNSWLVNPYMEVKRVHSIGLPERWASPELIKASSEPQKSSDVYALGMTIYEVMTGEEPYNEFSTARALFEIAAKREPPRRPESIPNGCETGDNLWALLLRCWSYEPGARPSAIEVEESMTAIHSTLIQSRKMAAREIVSHLVARGCPEISSQLTLSSFNDYPTISEGGFSDIYQGQLLDGTVVALKVLRVSTDTITQPKHLKHAAMELYTWNRCNHPNIMPLLGLTVFRSRIGMVSVWMKHGNLPKYLKKELGANRLHMCTQICEGVTYLHQINVVHCDLKGANVLVSDEGIPVLTDFGASSVFNQTLRFTPTTSGLTYTLRWSAAEIIKETHPHTKASDVYALGMIIYEAISGKIPYDGKKDYNVMFLVTQEKELPERPERMPNGEEIKNELWELLTRCWSYEREARPNAYEVKEAIDKIAGSDGSSTSSRQKRRLGRFDTWLTRRAH